MLRACQGVAISDYAMVTKSLPLVHSDAENRKHEKALQQETDDDNRWY